jgi:hypothetical protein
MTEEQRNIRITILIVCVNLPIALLHFVTGSHYAGPFPGFVNGYLIDILLPFGFYFLLCPSEKKLKFLKPWYVKSALVFLAGSIVEMSQFFGIPIFGETFDPLDFVMYGLGGTLAAIFDILLFPKIFKFWNPETRG